MKCLLIILLFPLLLSAQQTYVPDDNFKSGIVTSVKYYNKLSLGAWLNEYSYDSTYNITQILTKSVYEDRKFNNLRYLYSYDKNGNELNWTLQRTSSGQWVLFKKGEKAYDEKGNLLIDLSEELLNDIWYKNKYFKYGYDVNGKKISEYYESWAWEKLKSRDSTVFKYSDNGICDTIIHFSGLSGNWNINFRNMIIYDENDRITLYLNQYWRGNEWINEHQTKYVYDNHGNRLSELMEFWIDNSWVGTKWRQFTYDKNGNLLTELYQRNENNIWKYIYKDTFEYNENNLLTYRLYESFLIGDFDYRTFYTYDTDGNMLLVITQKKLDSCEWQNDVRQNYSYNKDGYNTYQSFEIWENGEWKLTDLSGLSFYDSFGRFFSFDANKIEVTYIEPTNIDEQRVNINNSISISPNPASDHIEINVPRWRGQGVDLMIFDVLGVEQPTSAQPLSMLGEGARIDVSGLAPGVYFVKVGDRLEKFIKI